MTEKKYTWTWTGLILGLALLVYRIVIVELEGNYSIWISSWPMILLLILPLLLTAVGLILDVKITNKNVKEVFLNELKKQPKITFITKYAFRGAIICFIYSLFAAPSVSAGGMLRGIGYFILMFPAAIISIPFLNLFWPLIDHPPDILTIALTSFIFSIEGFLVGFIIPNFKQIVAFYLKNKKKVMKYIVIGIIVSIFLSITLYHVSNIREDLTWKSYGLEWKDQEFCKNIKNKKIYDSCIAEINMEKENNTAI